MVFVLAFSSVFLHGTAFGTNMIIATKDYRIKDESLGELKCPPETRVSTWRYENVSNTSMTKTILKGQTLKSKLEESEERGKKQDTGARSQNSGVKILMCRPQRRVKLGKMCG